MTLLLLYGCSHSEYVTVVIHQYPQDEFGGERYRNHFFSTEPSRVGGRCFVLHHHLFMSESWVISCSWHASELALSLSVNFYKSFLESFCLSCFILSLEKASRRGICFSFLWCFPTYSGHSIFLTLQLNARNNKKAIVDTSVYIHSIDTLSQKFLSELNPWKVYSALQSSDLHQAAVVPPDPVRDHSISSLLVSLPPFLHISVCVTDVCQHQWQTNCGRILLLFMSLSSFCIIQIFCSVSEA